jgi:hypothetical protein
VNQRFCLPATRGRGHSERVREVSRPQGEVFLDARGNGRAMRLTWHHESDLVVLSMWRDGMCAGTFRLAKEDVNPFIDALIDGLRDAPGVQVATPGAHRSAGEPPAERPEPHEAVHTGESTFPELSDTDHEDAPPPFTEWAFDDQANAS